MQATRCIKPPLGLLFALILWPWVPPTKGADSMVWAASSPRQLILTEDLVIGSQPQQADAMLGRVADIALDSRGNIYVLDSGFVTVKKFSSSGVYMGSIGRSGEGPGEFLRPLSMALDSADLVYVAGVESYINVFDQDGKFMEQFHRGNAGSLVRSMAIDAAGNLYIVCLDLSSQLVIHKLNRAREYVHSFCPSYAVGSEEDTRIETVFAGGYIDLDSKGSLFYTQMTPLEVRVFTLQGELLSWFKGSSVAQSQERGSTIPGGVTLRVPPTSNAIVALDDGTAMNALFLPDEDLSKAQTVLGVYQQSGELMAECTLQGFRLARCRDRQGRIYVAEERDEPVVVRYKIESK